MEQKKKVKNFLISSLSGMLFSGSQGSGEDELTEEEINKTIFDSKGIGLFKITAADFGYSILGFTEDIFVYYSKSQNEIWNYNPIMSAATNSMVYSPVILFVSESLIHKEKAHLAMEYDLFRQIVESWLSTLNNFVKGANSEFSEQTEETEQEIQPQEKTGKKKPERKSKLYNLSEIKYCFGHKNEYKIKVKRDINYLDDFWKEHYVRAYHPDLCFTDVKSLDLLNHQESLDALMLKPGLLTLILGETGKVVNYFGQLFSNSDLEEYNKKLNEMNNEFNTTISAQRLSETEIQKRYEEEKENIQKEFFKKIAS